LGSGQPFYYLRYVLPMQAFLVATIAIGAVVLFGWAWNRRRSASAPACAIAVAAVALVALARLPSSLAERAHLYSWNCQNIEELNVAMAMWLRDNVPAGEAILVSDAGAARYFAQHRILDVAGLNNHGWLHREPRAVAELSQARYASLFPSSVPELTRSPAWRPIHRASTLHLTICQHCLQSEIVAYQRVQPDGQQAPWPPGK
jgi:hypothetical protein